MMRIVPHNMSLYYNSEWTFKLQLKVFWKSLFRQKTVWSQALFPSSVKPSPSGTSHNIFKTAQLPDWLFPVEPILKLLEERELFLIQLYSRAPHVNPKWDRHKKKKSVSNGEEDKSWHAVMNWDDFIYWGSQFSVELGNRLCGKIVFLTLNKKYKIR